MEDVILDEAVPELKSYLDSFSTHPYLRGNINAELYRLLQEELNLKVFDPERELYTLPEGMQNIADKMVKQFLNQNSRYNDCIMYTHVTLINKINQI